MAEPIPLPADAGLANAYTEEYRIKQAKGLQAASPEQVEWLAQQGFSLYRASGPFSLDFWRHG